MSPQTMRHPLRSLAGQGFWYTLSNVVTKLGGLVLLPLYTNAEFLSVAAFGVWGVFEVTVSVAIAVLGLQLGLGFVRFYPDVDETRNLISTTWWITSLMAAGSGIIGLLLIHIFVPEADRSVYWWLIVYIASELLLAIPLALFRARGQAAGYTILSAGKLAAIIGFNLLWLAEYRLGLLGLVRAFAVSSLLTLCVGLIVTNPFNYFSFRLKSTLARDLLRFSVPLILGGIGSMVLNAGDRYVLAIFRPAEDIALYTLAAKIGGVVNMFGVQPLQLAFLPILFRLAVGQHVEVLRLLSKYLAFGFGLLVVGLSLFTIPVLELVRSDPFYAASDVLVPWIAMGFSFFGFSILFDGVLTLHHRTGTTAGWVALASVVNLVLNVIFIPWFGALAAAVTTFASYALLFAGRLYSSQRLSHVSYEWIPIAGIFLATAVVAVAGSLVPFPAGLAGWFWRLAVVVLWGVVILLARWLTIDEFKAVWSTLKGS